MYVRQLLPSKRGYPLSPSAAPGRGVRIGDVGAIAPDGSFAFAFNACAAADDPVNSHGVPHGFRPLAISPDRVVRAGAGAPGEGKGKGAENG